DFVAYARREDRNQKDEDHREVAQDRNALPNVEDRDEDPLRCLARRRDDPEEKSDRERDEVYERDPADREERIGWNGRDGRRADEVGAQQVRRNKYGDGRKESQTAHGALPDGSATRLVI